MYMRGTAAFGILKYEPEKENSMTDEQVISTVAGAIAAIIVYLFFKLGGKW